jgi:hypothetical protein
VSVVSPARADPPKPPRPEPTRTGGGDLRELDGVDGRANAGVLVLAATNRRAALDDALLRPGRLHEVGREDAPSPLGSALASARREKRRRLAVVRREKRRSVTLVERNDGA